MKIVACRVKKSKVEVDKKICGQIKHGLLLLVCMLKDDDESKLDYMVKKCVNLRIFDDENGNMNKSILDVNGEILSISQFTLAGDTKKGNRPSFINAKDKDEANRLYKIFNEKLRHYVKVEEGVFGADMQITSHFDGPITILIDN